MQTQLTTKISFNIREKRNFGTFSAENNQNLINHAQTHLQTWQQPHKYSKTKKGSKGHFSNSNSKPIPTPKWHIFYKLPEPSLEQINIINELKSCKHVYVDAVAGSGKTTTVLNLANELKTHSCLQITFNKALKFEVRHKVDQLKLKNLDIHSYHSLAVRYYHRSGKDDAGLNRILEGNMPPKKLKKYDIVIVDEVQDMSMLYYQFLHKFLADLRCSVQMLVLGDKFQSVYDFRGADPRFLTLSPQIYDVQPFVSMPLKTSYRVTKQMAYFINNGMLGHSRLISEKSGQPVYYIDYNPFYAHKFIWPELKWRLKKKQIEPQDIYVLAPSVKSQRCPARKLENFLVSKGLPCFVPISDEQESESRLTEGKVVFTTFHQSKGTERRVVIVFGFDAGYYKYHAKDKPRDICPAPLYVAVTRASELLMVVQGDKPLPFFRFTPDEMRRSQHINYCTSNKMEDIEVLSQPIHTTTPIKLVRFLNDSAVKEFQTLVNKLFKPICEATYSIEIPCEIKTDTGREDVSDLNGLVIPVIWEENKTQRWCSILMNAITENQNDPFLQKKQSQLKIPCQSIPDYLYLGNYYLALSEGYHFKLAQVNHYNWLVDSEVKKCHEIMDQHIKSQSLEFEKTLHVNYPHEKFGMINIVGRLDALDNEYIYEFKCVDSLKLEHFLQVIVYSWMWRNLDTKPPILKFRLLNIKTGEVQELDVANTNAIDEIVEKLFYYRFSQQRQSTDEDFIKQCKEVTTQFSNQQQITSKSLPSRTDPPLSFNPFSSQNSNTPLSCNSFSSQNSNTPNTPLQNFANSQPNHNINVNFISPPFLIDPSRQELVMFDWLDDQFRSDYPQWDINQLTVTLQPPT